MGHGGEREGGLMNCELIISDVSENSRALIPDVVDGLQWVTERRGVPGKLTFSVLGDKNLVLEEGAAVRLSVDGNPLFFGFVFSKKSGKNGIISVTAYDQLRYLNNKDTYVYENKTASQFIKMLADDFSLKTGIIEDTKFVIASEVEDNSSLFDMINNALDITLQNTGEMFVLFDDFGKLTLRKVSSMYVGGAEGYLLIDDSGAEDFDFTSSIDSDTYNKIKLTFDNENSGKREVYIARDSANINAWGVLQYYDTLSEGENGKAKADALLKLYNQKKRGLKITKAFGDVRVRAGSLIAVKLDLGGAELKNFMLVERAAHTFKNGEHFMDLTLKGGGFNA